MRKSFAKRNNNNNLMGKLANPTTFDIIGFEHIL